MSFKMFDFVSTRDNTLGFVASEKMKIPYIQDGAGSSNAHTPCLFSPEDFDFFEGYLVYLMPEGNYEVYADHSIKICDTKDIYEQTRIFDHATSGLRFHLSLLEYLRKNSNYLK